MQRFNLGRSNAYAQMKMLARFGIIKHVMVLPDLPGVYFLTAKAVRLIDTDLPLITYVPINHYSHYIEVLRVYLTVRESHPDSTWITERRLIRQKYDDMAGSKDHLPDGILILPDEKRIAIEVELSLKGRDRLLNILTDYVVDKAIHEVWYFCSPKVLLVLRETAAVVIPDRYINQIALVLGTTGSGKTVTLQRFYQRAMMQKYPLIIIDGKPDVGNINLLTELAKRYNRRFIGFNCGNYLPYDTLAHGNFTELKDKIICLKDVWENDYYRSIAEDYLQTTFEVLLKSGGDLDLKRVVDCLTYSKLKLLATVTKDAALIDRVKELKNYKRKDITGLQAHLNILINSELG